MHRRRRASQSQIACVCSTPGRPGSLPFAGAGTRRRRGRRRARVEGNRTPRPPRLTRRRGARTATPDRDRADVGPSNRSFFIRDPSRAAHPTLSALRFPPRFFPHQSTAAAHVHACSVPRHPRHAFRPPRHPRAARTIPTPRGRLFPALPPCPPPHPSLPHPHITRLSRPSRHRECPRTRPRAGPLAVCDRQCGFIVLMDRRNCPFARPPAPRRREKKISPTSRRARRTPR